eukprot:5988226-Prorocentrum_lima.AAC.1
MEENSEKANRGILERRTSEGRQQERRWEDPFRARLGEEPIGEEADIYREEGSNLGEVGEEALAYS